MEWLISAYDSLELWLVRLPYPLLVTLVLVVMLPVCWLLARVINAGVEVIARMVTRNRGEQETPVAGEQS